MRSPALLLSILCLAFASTAQVTLVRGSGCANTLMPLWRGSAKINSTFSVFCPMGNVSETSFALIGAPLASPIVIGPPIGCSARCNLSTLPLMVVALGYRQPTLTVNIPNSPSLVGSVARVQCTALISRTQCHDLRGALDAKITR